MSFATIVIGVVIASAVVGVISFMYWMLFGPGFNNEDGTNSHGGDA